MRSSLLIHLQQNMVNVKVKYNFKVHRDAQSLCSTCVPAKDYSAECTVACGVNVNGSKMCPKVGEYRSSQKGSSL